MGSEFIMNDNLHTEFKYSHVLQIYTRLLNGEVINKESEAERFGVHPRSIQRDLDDLRAFFENESINGNIDKILVYSRKLNGYYLSTRESVVLSNSEILAVCKILLESRAFRRDEITPIIDKLLVCCVPKKNQEVVKHLISNEMFHYIEPQHKKAFIGSLWDIGLAIKEQKMMKIYYEKQDQSVVQRMIQPVGIIFSEYYFYLTAFIDKIDKEKEFKNKDDIFPTIYRIDRIQKFQVLQKHFDIPYKNRFEEGEFRKRVQFMYGGKLRKIKFLFKGVSPEPVLDRLPTAKILKQNQEGYIISAEVFGDGIDMWIKSQGDKIELL